MTQQLWAHFILENTHDCIVLRNVVGFHPLGPYIIITVKKEVLESKTNKHESILQITDGAKIKSVQSSDVFAGTVSKAELQKIIDLNLATISSCICLIMNYTHSTSLCFNIKEKKWVYYDSNYPDITKTFNREDLGNLVDSIFFSLSTTSFLFTESKLSLAIQVASTAEEIVNLKKPSLSAIGLISGLGLNMIASWATKTLPELLQNLNSSKEGQAALIIAIGEKANDGWTCLQTVARYAPASLPELLEILERSEEGRAAAPIKNYRTSKPSI